MRFTLKITRTAQTLRASFHDLDHRVHGSIKLILALEERQSHDKHVLQNPSPKLMHKSAGRFSGSSCNPLELSTSERTWLSDGPVAMRSSTTMTLSPGMIAS